MQMSESLPEDPISGILRVLKLVSGEELVGLVNESSPDKITIKLPAKLETYTSKDQNGNLLDYVKLTNYLANIKGSEISIFRSSVIYIGQPNIELEKMYEIFFVAMQSDPKSVVSAGSEELTDVQPGLELLNNLFNNDEFVNFVNDLIETYEGIEIITEEELQDGFRDEEIKPKPEEQKKKKKRSKGKRESSKLPYDPQANPNSAEAWSDNPEDYM